jgi:WhiB family redox-sensing transcriptional regulator
MSEQALVELAGPATRGERRRRRVPLDLPCRREEPDLWFAESPTDLERAKALCASCPIRLACLAVAVHRAEFAGVWGGHIFDRGRIVPYKRARGRPRKHQPARAASPGGRSPSQEQGMITSIAPAPNHRLHVASRRLYDAECALHVAHQSGVEAWISAANEKLHDAVTEYLDAEAGRPAKPPERPRRRLITS